MNIGRHRPRIVASFIAITLAFGIGALVIFLSGQDPALAVYTIFQGAFGNYNGLAGTLNLTAVLLLTGLAALMAFSAKIWNVGMEGQLYMGGLASVAISFAAPNIGLLAIPVAASAGLIGGALYAVVPGILKAKLNVNEIVSSLLLNFVALLFVDYIAGGPLHQEGAALPRTPTIPDGFKLTTFPGSFLNFSIVVAIAASVLVAFLLKRTRFGFEIRIMGGNRRAAQYVGVKTSRNTVLIMLLSGALAGLAGSMLALGTTHAWFGGVSKFYGYLGIGVALLAQLSPIAVVFSALFFSMLNEGGIAMQSVTGVPFEVSQVIAAIILIVILIRTVLERVT